MNINDLIAAARAVPAHTHVIFNAHERADAFEAQAVARGCAGWAQLNREALNYTGPSVAAITSQMNAIDAKIEFHKKEVLRLRAELIRVTGGQAAVNAAAAAGMDVVFDRSLVDGQYTNEKARFALAQQRDKISTQLVAAQAGDRAKSERATILSALLAGGLQ